MSICSQRLSGYLYTLLLAIGLSCATAVAADERILDFQSDVLIHSDGNLLVTETIRVNAEGGNIRRGIFRDFPTDYKDRFGNRYKVDLNVLDVSRNGVKEPFHTEKRDNGIRIYMGSSNQLIDNGVHEYQLRYRTGRQLGFFEDYDELYWNVTGNGWMFPIDHASARIELPVDVNHDDLRISFYTGPQGTQGRQARSEFLNNRTIAFETTRGLQAYEGLTVALGWPKGIVTEPTLSQHISHFLRDNRSALVLLTGLFASFALYLQAWRRHGRDPETGVIIPRFKPPMGLTAAGCSYILKMSFSKQTFSAAVVSLAIKGYLEITQNDDEFTLKKTAAGGNGKASSGESAVLDRLFESSPVIELDQKNHRAFIKARSELKKALKNEHLGRVFKLNSVYAVPSLILSVLAMIIASRMQISPIVLVISGGLFVVLHLSFLFLLRAPTPTGRRIMDEIEGFKMYLDTAEQDRLDMMKSPQLTPEVFESFLPFAFALGVENSWCERFTRELPEELTNKGGYQPGWYSGDQHRLGALSHLGDDFNDSFSSAISSASTAPGSSSGSGGGGSSGGGGGGGGGGGW